MTTYLEKRLEWYDHNYRIGNALIKDKQFKFVSKQVKNKICFLLTRYKEKITYSFE